MKTIQEVRNEFEQILSEVTKINGVSTDSAVQVATAILHESGKFQRTEMLQGSNQNNSNRYSNQPATDKQKYALRKNNVDFSENITKAEASALLDKVMPKSGSNAKGRPSPAFSSSAERIVPELETRYMKTEEEQDTEWCPYCDSAYHEKSDCPACASFYDTLGFSD